ncbi:MAG: NAD(P)H-dependent oxidoreductase [Actinomycetota bacterium]|nr:NAD(P)H-dependent oxidoreductase [Actinomycetota bacterium]
MLRTVQALAPPAVEAIRYARLAELPHFNPDDDAEPLHAAAQELRGEIRIADAMLCSTPEYAGALPGSFKNLLDWTIGDDQPGSIYRKPVAWINTSPRGAAAAHDSLRAVLGYAHADIIEAACAHIPVTAAMLDSAGLIADGPTRDRIAEVLTVLTERVRDGLGTEIDPVGETG